MKTKPRILWILGNHHHNTMLSKVAETMTDCDHRFSPYYCDPWSGPDLLRRARLGEHNALGFRFRNQCFSFLKEKQLELDLHGRKDDYDLVVTCSDLVMPSNILDKPIVAIQEGMVDPKLFWYKVRKRITSIPRWAAGTSCMGLSNQYDKYCLAGDTYVDDYAARGAERSRLVATGIPIYDNLKSHLKPGHWLEGHALACSSDGREVFRLTDNRKKFIKWCVKLADGRPLVFKFHPNEKMERAVKEVEKWAPGSKCITEGMGEELAANCDVLITEWSTLAFVGIACGKETHSYREFESMKRLLPDQHGRAAENIADVCRDVIETRGGRTRMERLAGLRQSQNHLKGSIKSWVGLR